MSKLKKKLKTQGKNSKLKTKTQFFGIFRILRCEKGVQKKPGLNSSPHFDSSKIDNTHSQAPSISFACCLLFFMFNF